MPPIERAHDPGGHLGGAAPAMSLPVDFERGSRAGEAPWSGGGGQRPVEPQAAAHFVEPFGPLGRRLLLLCKVAAVAGTLVFTALVAMSIVSITGRKLWSAPIPGDVELLQLCSAFAAASFFAYCHLNRGDVKVDFFTDRLPVRAVHALDAVGSLLVGLFGALVAWRTGAGALMVGQAGETSMILGVPLWIGQALMVPGFVLLAAAGFYMAGWHVRHALHRRAS